MKLNRKGCVWERWSLFQNNHFKQNKLRGRNGIYKINKNV